jgi:hypothetical protein
MAIDGSALSCAVKAGKPITSGCCLYASERKMRNYGRDAPNNWWQSSPVTHSGENIDMRAFGETIGKMRPS